jgi:acyl carrier protein
MKEETLIESKVIKILSTILKHEANTLTSTDTDPEWDSLKHLHIIFALEDEFEVSVEEEMFGELNSFQNILKYLTQRHE